MAKIELKLYDSLNDLAIQLPFFEITLSAWRYDCGLFGPWHEMAQTLLVYEDNSEFFVLEILIIDDFYDVSTVSVFVVVDGEQPKALDSNQFRVKNLNFVKRSDIDINKYNAIPLFQIDETIEIIDTPGMVVMYIRNFYMNELISFNFHGIIPYGENNQLEVIELLNRTAIIVYQPNNLNRVSVEN
ncbi:hypothetical protein RF11_07639 [Thelohanellus kitauei]|uniref:Uncharacterized protein n=1 Tax=Thelohanellus kitauei TaxID=669202 RepID=A0A0C2I4Z3_THEKT|nr:hypothetical protein RF11_07639 [Thelohanellus kitauei]